MAAAEHADYTFTGTAGQVVYLQAHDPCVGTLSWDLIGPSGGSLGGSLICNDLQREVLKDPGTYVVRVNGDRTATGAYSFTVLAVPATVVMPATVGQPVTGSLVQPVNGPSTRSPAAPARRSTSSTVARVRRRSSGRSTIPLLA